MYTHNEETTMTTLTVTFAIPTDDMTERATVQFGEEQPATLLDAAHRARVRDMAMELLHLVACYELREKLLTGAKQ